MKRNIIKNRIKLSDEFFAFILFGMPCIISYELPLEIINLYFLIAITGFVFYNLKGKFVVNTKILKVSLVFSVSVLLLSLSQGRLQFGSLFFVLFWPLLVSNRITFDPKFVVIPIFLLYISFSEYDFYSTRSSFFLDSNFSSLLIIPLQFILIKNRRYVLFFVSLIFLPLLQSRMLIISDVLLIIFLFFRNYQLFSSLIRRILNLKIVLLIAIFLSFMSGTIMKDYMDNSNWKGGYRYGLKQRMFGGFDDLSNKTRINSNSNTLTLLMNNPTYFITGIDFKLYKKEMHLKGSLIAHNFFFGAIISFGFAGFILFYLVYLVCGLEYLPINKMLVLIWIFCASVLNVHVFVSYSGVLFLFSIMVVSRK